MFMKTVQWSILLPTKFWARALRPQSGRSCPDRGRLHSGRHSGRLRIAQTLVLVAGLAVFAASSSWAQPIALDDHFEAFDARLSISETQLLANDLATPNAWVRIVEAPRRGHLTPTVYGFEYQQTGLFLGLDAFSYEVVDSGEVSAPVQVTLRFVLESQPLAGRWPTPTCNETACPVSCAAGETFELGWYHRDIQTFELCDWHGGLEFGNDCVDYQVPIAVAKGGFPLVFDWDNDGWDEPALHDWQNGRVLFFEDSGAPCPGEEKGRCLQLAETLDLGASLGTAGRHAWPLAQQWSAAGVLIGQADTLAAYDSVQELLHQGFDAGTFAATDPFEHGFGSVPMIGDWLGNGIETIAVWDDGKEKLLKMVDPRSLSTVAFTPGYPSELIDQAWPFAAPQDGCGASVLALYDPCQNELYLRDLLEPNLERGSTQVNIPVDPGGYPKSWPSCSGLGGQL